MRIEILGSGGALPTPRPGCTCRVCKTARREGGRDERCGPSVFVHGLDLLIDTPEEIRLQLERASIGRVAAGLYSHWHPDHTAGRRIWETYGMDFRGWPRAAKRTVRTPVYLPQQVAADFAEWMGLGEHFDYLERQGTVERRVVPDGGSFELGGVRVTPTRLAEDYVYAFLLEEGERRVLVAMDELNGWVPPPLGRLDLALLPIGLHEHDPWTGKRLIAADHPVLPLEATYPETLAIVRALDASRTVLSHVEEMNGLPHAELERLGDRDGWEAAYDGLVLDV